MGLVPVSAPRWALSNILFCSVLIFCAVNISGEGIYLCIVLQGDLPQLKLFTVVSKHLHHSGLTLRSPGESHSVLKGVFIEKANGLITKITAANLIQFLLPISFH